MKITTDGYSGSKKMVLCNGQPPRIYLWIPEERAAGKEISLPINDALILAIRNKFIGVILLPHSLHIVKVCRNHHGDEPVIRVNDLDFFDQVHEAIAVRVGLSNYRNTHKEIPFEKEMSVTA
jgi:hypothetical protein